MQIDLQKIINYLLIGLAILIGLTTGMLSARILSFSFGNELGFETGQTPDAVALPKLTDDQLQVILQRSLFNAAAAGEDAEQLDLSVRRATGESAAPPPAKPVGNLTLIGTVVADAESFALIQVGREVGLYHLNDEVAPGVELQEVRRNLVVLNQNGRTSELELLPADDLASGEAETRPGSTPSSSSAVSPAAGIVGTGDNRYQVSKEVAENARNNLNQLLQSARMIPEVKDGETIGFRLVELKRGSLLQQIGLRVGDLVVEINGVELNSPEKALQIFQQVREAANISVGLIRNNKREMFDYVLE